jgi:hypothetical protein
VSVCFCLKRCIGFACCVASLLLLPLPPLLPLPQMHSEQSSKCGRAVQQWY